MDGALDWYVLGVVLGLGIAAGAATVGALRAPAWVALAVVAGVGALALVFLVLPWWTIAAFAAALLVGFLALRRLSPEAIPAAILAAVVLAAIPLLGYVAVVATPVAGARLNRRAEARHAGLRILAKD
jgi:glycerol-3-phosphate acyltransferase PlsY